MGKLDSVEPYLNPSIMLPCFYHMRFIKGLCTLSLVAPIYMPIYTEYLIPVSVFIVNCLILIRPGHRQEAWERCSNLYFFFIFEYKKKV